AAAAVAAQWAEPAEAAVVAAGAAAHGLDLSGSARTRVVRTRARDDRSRSENAFGQYPAIRSACSRSTQATSGVAVACGSQSDQFPVGHLEASGDRSRLDPLKSRAHPALCSEVALSRPRQTTPHALPATAASRRPGPPKLVAQAVRVQCGFGLGFGTAV